MFASWFTGTCLCKVKHKTQGGHQLYPSQVRDSDPEYKNDLFANIKKAMEDQGNYAKVLITEHGTPKDLRNYLNN